MLKWRLNVFVNSSKECMPLPNLLLHTWYILRDKASHESGQKPDIYMWQVLQVSMSSGCIAKEHNTVCPKWDVLQY